MNDDIKNAYYDGYDAGYKAGFEAGQRDVLMKDLPPAQPEQRWIPCREMLPENFISVLYCTSKEIIELGYFDYLGDTWCSMYGDPAEFMIGEEVTAWMPLPEPWKEGETE